MYCDGGGFLVSVCIYILPRYMLSMYLNPTSGDMCDNRTWVLVDMQVLAALLHMCILQYVYRNFERRKDWGVIHTYLSTYTYKTHWPASREIRGREENIGTPGARH